MPKKKWLKIPGHPAGGVYFKEIPEHPAGRAYIEQFNAKADAMTDEEATAKLNKFRARRGLPPLTVEQVFGGSKGE